MSKTKRLFWVGCWVLLTGCSILQKNQPLYETLTTTDSLALKNVQVVDVVSKRILADRTLLIQDGIIEGVYASSDSLPTDIKYHSLPADNLYLMPGLIDGHVHLQGTMEPPGTLAFPALKQNAQRMLVAGITTAFDLAGSIKAIEKLDNTFQTTDQVGPDIFYTDKMLTAVDGYPIPWLEVLGWPMNAWPIKEVLKHLIANQVENRSDIDQVLNRIDEHGGSMVKIGYEKFYPTSPLLFSDLLSYTCDAAKWRGLKVFAHLSNNHQAQEAIRAGVDVFTHNIYAEAIQPSTLLKMKEHDIKVIPTAMMFQRITELVENQPIEWTPLTVQLTPEKTLRELEAFQEKDADEIHPTLKTFYDELAEQQSMRDDNIRLMIQAGISLIIGSDSPVIGLQAGAGLHEELHYLHRLGISTPDLIKMVTWGNAQHLEITDRGKIEPGMRADLILLERNPLESLEALDQILFVVAKGRVVSNRFGND